MRGLPSSTVGGYRLAIVAVLVAAGAAGAWAATAHRAPVASKPPEHALTGQNPLLPTQIDAAALIPELPLLQKMPTMAPAGFLPLYSDADWAGFRGKFGEEADAVGAKKASLQLDLAQRMFDAALSTPERTGINRLVMLRVVAIAYRNKDGSTLVAKAIDAYQTAMDRNLPTHVAGLWQMADIVARYSATPRELRPKYSLLAAKANVQLAMLLLDGGQVQAAQGIIKMLGRHEAALKLDPPFKAQAANARALVGQTIIMMDEMAAQIAALQKGDANAPMRLYLYGRFAARPPLPADGGISPAEIVQKIVERDPGSSAAAMDQAINKANADVLAAFDAAEMLKAAAAGLGEGILKHRVLAAARDGYTAFLASPLTDSERVKRTLARIAREAVVSDGASAQPRIRPLEAPPATQPAAATQAARR